MTIDDAAGPEELGIGSLTVQDIIRLRGVSYRAQVRDYLLAWLEARHHRSHQPSY